MDYSQINQFGRKLENAVHKLLSKHQKVEAMIFSKEPKWIAGTYQLAKTILF